MGVNVFPAPATSSSSTPAGTKLFDGGFLANGRKSVSLPAGTLNILGSGLPNYEAVLYNGSTLLSAKQGYWPEKTVSTFSSTSQDAVLQTLPSLITVPNNGTVSYANGAWFLGKASGGILRSTDSIAWTEVLTTTRLLSEVQHNGTLFVALFTDGTTATSTDGVAWTELGVVVMNMTQGYFPTEAQNGWFCLMVRYPFGNCKLSTDGVNWIGGPAAVNSPRSNVQSFAYQNGIYSWYRQNSSAVFRTTDPTLGVFDSVTAPTTQGGMTAGDGYFVIFDKLVYTNPRYWISTDAVTWTMKELPAKNIIVPQGTYGEHNNLTAAIQTVGSIRKVGGVWYVFYTPSTTTLGFAAPSLVFTLGNITDPSTLSATPVGAVPHFDEIDSSRYRATDGTTFMFGSTNVSAGVRKTTWSFDSNLQEGSVQLFNDFI